MSNRRFAGKTVVITGAGSGIGADTAARFAAEGAQVVIADLDPAAGERVAGSLDGALACRVDVADPQSVQEMAALVKERCGRLDVLINGAHHYTDGDFLTIDPMSLQLDLAVTLHGAIFVSQALLPVMIDSGGGVVLNIASVNGLGWYGGHSYSAAKAGLLHFTRTLAAQFADRNIRACAIAPGTIDTPAWAESKKQNPDVMDEVAQVYPLRRVGQVADIANALLFLAGDEASWITGVTLPVEGGILLTNSFPPIR